MDTGSGRMNTSTLTTSYVHWNVYHGSSARTLGGVEAGPQHHGQAAAVRGADARIFVGPSVLQDARPAKQDLQHTTRRFLHTVLNQY